MATIYFIEAPKQNLVKIGRTTNVEQRFATIQSCSPVKLHLRSTIKNVDPSVETLLHHVFDTLRRRGEWFTISKELRHLIDNPKSLDVDKYRQLLKER